MKKRIIEKGVVFIGILFLLFAYFTKTYNNKIVAILILITDIYAAIKYKDDIRLFFLFICILYFDYSFIISKYLSSTNNFRVTFENGIFYDSSMFIGVTCVLLFHFSMLLALKKIPIKYEKQSNDKRKNEVVCCLLTIAIVLILFDYLFIHFLIIKRAIYEYLLILYILLIFFSKNNKKYNRICLLLILFSAAINMQAGGRIVTLQPIIAYVLIMLSDRMNKKMIIFFSIIGIIVFTIAGLYGDKISEGTNVTHINQSEIIETFINRKFALDTSISSYWTGITFIETSHLYTVKDRLLNFIAYLTSYTILGSKSGYQQIFDISKQYYTHYYGGFLPMYFYYWLGIIGPIIAGFLIALLLNKCRKQIYEKNELGELVYIYIISSSSRWYLYYPTTLIRSLIIFIIAYLLVKLLNNSIQNKEPKEENLIIRHEESNTN